MKRSAPLRKTPLRNRTELHRRCRMKARRADRAAAKFLRNFHSPEYVAFTKAQPCAFCGRQYSPRYMVTGHVNARGGGGCGGNWTRTLPFCRACDRAWDGVGGGRKTFLRRMGLSWVDVELKLAAHQQAWKAAT